MREPVKLTTRFVSSVRRCDWSMAFIGRLPRVGDVHRVWDVEHRVYSFTSTTADLFVSLCVHVHISVYYRGSSILSCRPVLAMWLDVMCSCLGSDNMKQANI